MHLAPGTTTLASGTFRPLQTAGPALVWVITLALVFAECAFLIGLFLPGDSLLLTAGVVLAASGSSPSAWGLAAAATVAAIVGNQVGFRLGKYSGGRIMAREGGRMLNRRNLLKASAVMTRWGFWGVLAARWIPWVRTLAPMLAGAAHMDQRRFTAASVLGAIVWVPTLVLIGYYGAGVLERVSWLLPVALWTMVAFLVVGTGIGVWRYRQELRKPVDAEASAEVVEAVHHLDDAQHGHAPTRSEAGGQPG